MARLGIILGLAIGIGIVILVNRFLENRSKQKLKAFMTKKKANNLKQTK